MIVQLFAFRDVKVGVYGPIQMFQNTAILQRTMGEHLSSGRGDDLSRYPADFDCYNIGSYDDDTGLVAPLEAPVFVFNCGVLKDSFEKPAASD